MSQSHPAVSCFFWAQKFLNFMYLMSVISADNWHTEIQAVVFAVPSYRASVVIKHITDKYQWLMQCTWIYMLQAAMHRFQPQVYLLLQ